MKQEIENEFAILFHDLNHFTRILKFLLKICSSVRIIIVSEFLQIELLAETLDKLMSVTLNIFTIPIYEGCTSQQWKLGFRRGCYIQDQKAQIGNFRIFHHIQPIPTFHDLQVYQIQRYSIYCKPKLLVLRTTTLLDMTNSVPRINQKLMQNYS